MPRRQEDGGACDPADGGDGDGLILDDGDGLGDAAQLAEVDGQARRVERRDAAECARNRSCAMASRPSRIMTTASQAIMATADRDGAGASGAGRPRHRPRCPWARRGGSVGSVGRWRSAAAGRDGDGDSEGAG